MNFFAPFILVALLFVAVKAVAEQAAIPVVPVVQAPPAPSIENGDAVMMYSRAREQLALEGKKKDNLESAKWMALHRLAGGSAIEAAALQIQAEAAKLTPDELAQGRVLARDWLRKQATALSPGILSILMRAYATGAFGEPNYDEAYFWHILLQERNPAASPVVEGVGDITSLVSPHDRDAVKELVRKWKLDEIPAYMKDGYNPNADPATQGGEVEENPEARRKREIIESDVRRNKE